MSTLTALGLLTHGHIHPVAVGLAAATILMSLARMIVTYREADDLAGSHQLALTDDLTGLGNRRALYVRSESVLAEPDIHAALLLLDLDRFKHVNDTLGHPAGDELIREVAHRLTHLVREQDTVARLGGDEFGIILTDIKSEESVRTLCLRILESVRSPFEIAGALAHVGVSIGVALLAPHHRGLDDWMGSADRAMYVAKAASRARY